MSGRAFAQFVSYADIFGLPPKTVLRVCRIFGQYAVFENKTAACVNGKKPVYAAYVVILRQAVKSRRPVGLNDCTFVNVDAIYALYRGTVQRLVQAAAVVNQHNDDRPAVQPRPLNSRRRFFRPVEGVKGIRQKLLRVGVFGIKFKPVLDRLLCGRVNDFGEQPVFLVMLRQKCVRHKSLGLKTVRRGIVLRRTVLV